ncbi:MAG: hypothetical protein AAFV36_05400 [Myxococcota bacterium]
MDALGTTVLKCHLLVEKLLVRKIVDHLHGDTDAWVVRLSFPQKVALARSLSHRHFKAPQWELALELNSVRNRYAHGATDWKPLIGGLHNALRESDTYAREHVLPGHKGYQYIVTASTACLSNFVSDYDQALQSDREPLPLDLRYRHELSELTGTGKKVFEWCRLIEDQLLVVFDEHFEGLRQRISDREVLFGEVVESEWEIAFEMRRLLDRHARGAEKWNRLVNDLRFALVASCGPDGEESETRDLSPDEVIDIAGERFLEWLKKQTREVTERSSVPVPREAE